MYKLIIDTLFKPFVKHYLKFDTIFRYKHLKLKIIAGVFHPRFFFSSKYLTNFIEELDLTNLQFCEPCSGSGLISLIAYSKGANVLCFDINDTAVKNIEFNFNQNFKINSHGNSFTTVQSDGFTKVPLQLFDIIAINPPYFFKDITNVTQYAWYCGKNGEFFSHFFSELKNYLKPQGICYMVLADNCDIKKIEEIAIGNNILFTLVDEKKTAWEKNFIFKITF